MYLIIEPSWFKKSNRCFHIILAEKSDLASSKAEVEKIDIDKLITAPDDLSKVINVVDKVKNCVYE